MDNRVFMVIVVASSISVISLGSLWGFSVSTPETEQPMVPLAQEDIPSLDERIKAHQDRLWEEARISDLKADLGHESPMVEYWNRAQP